MKRPRDTDSGDAPSIAACDIHKRDGDDSVGDEEMAHFEAEEDEDSVGDEDIAQFEEDEDEDDCEDDDDLAAIDPESAHDALAKFMCLEGVNPNVVKCNGFRNFIATLSPSFTFDADKTKMNCFKFFEEAKPKAKQTLNNRDRLITLLVDVLTHYGHSAINDFICLSAHFVDDTWKLRKWVLRYQRYDMVKSGFVDAIILKTLDYWNLKDKVYSLTSRNIDVCDEVVESIKSGLQEKNRLPLDSRLFSVSCCAEMFGSIAEDAFDSISAIIDKVTWLQWSHSESMWHVTNHKLKNALDMESLGEFNSESIRNSYDVPSADECEKVRIVHQLVEDAYNVAKKVFETKHPTFNKFLYNLMELRENLITETTSSVLFSSNLAEKMLKKLNNYLKETFLVLAIASVMDPRCKFQYIEYISSKFKNIEGFLPGTAILETIKSIYADYLSRGVERENLERMSNLTAEEGNLESDNKEQFKNFPGGEEYSKFVQANNNVKKSDLDSYLEEPVLPWDENFNVLQWWKSEAPKYPNVAKMAREYLAIPISVATSYDAYYYLENRPPDYRVINSGPKMMNALMCCRSWKLDLNVDLE